MGDVSWFVETLKAIGWPGAMLIVFLRVAYQIGVWMKPWVERMFIAHESFLQRTGSAIERVNSTNEAIPHLADAIVASSCSDEARREAAVYANAFKTVIGSGGGDRSKFNPASQG